MRICLVRHAIAVAREGWQDADGGRPLTKKGRVRMEQAARGLATLFVPEAIISSPLLRARQTAQVLADTYHLSTPLFRDELATGADDALIDFVAQSDGDRVMLVGHEPHLSRLTSLLIAGHDAYASIVLKKGGAALIESDGPASIGRCRLLWLLEPGTLRALAED